MIYLSHRNLARTALALTLAALLASAAHATSRTVTTSSAVIYMPDKYGAKGDGATLDTVAIQKTIDAAAASKEPAVVAFKPGTYLTGSLFVKSGVALVIDKGVTLLGSQNIKDYPELPTRVAGIEMTWPSALINVYKQSNVAITGEGTIDGDGKIFWDSYWALRKIDEPKGLRWASDYDAKRPRLIQIFESSNVKLGGAAGQVLQLHRSGFWTVHICYSHHVLVDGVKIENNIPALGKAGRGPSTDGIDIDSSHHVEVMHADISVNDDALCLKAGRDSDGLRVNRPTTDIKLHDNIVRDGAAGITFGSETSGGFRNVEAWNITTTGRVGSGILFKSAHTRGGFVENINLHDFNISDVRSVLSVTMNWNPSYSYAVIPTGLTDIPLYYRVMTTPVPEGKGVAHVHDVHIWNIQATNAKTAFDVEAYKDAPLERFQFDHLNLNVGAAGHIADAANWKFTDTVITTADHSKVAVTDSTNVTGLPQ